MAAPKSARRSRKRRAGGRTPRAVPSTRRARPETAAPAETRGRSSISAYGARPEGPFGAVPVSELAILGGTIAVVYGWTQRASVALFTGLGLCFLGVLEVTAREHFSGYRSHATLLAGMAAVAVETALALLLHPHQRALLIIPLVPVFALSFHALRQRFSAARQARVRALPPA